MPRPKVVIDEITVLQAKDSLKKLKYGKLAIQLKAIIASSKHPVEQVGEIFNVSKRSIFRWVSKFKRDGIEGLKDKPKGHLKSKLSENELIVIEKWMLAGEDPHSRKTHWTLKKLKIHVLKEFKINISTIALWNHLKKRKLVLKKPRPVHYKADKEKQDSFKKN